MTNYRKLTLTSITMAIFILAGCTSIPIADVNQRINSWQSASFDQIIQYWGLPSKTTQVNDIYYAEWSHTEHQQGNSSVSVGSGTRIGNGAIGIGFTLFQLGGSDDTCNRTIRYRKSGEVIDIRWQGDQDFCYKLTPDRAEIRKNQATIDAES